MKVTPLKKQSKKEQGNVTVEGASDEVKGIFTVTGFDGMIPLF
nr:hypothetical protein [uncultured Ruminococcus sp.]